MLPLIPFAAGIAVGIVAIKAYKSEKRPQGWESAKKKLCTSADTAREKLRDGTVQGLSYIEQSSARLRDKLESGTPQLIQSSPRKAAKKSVVKKHARKS